MRTPAVDAHFLECTTILNGQKNCKSSVIFAFEKKSFENEYSEFLSFAIFTPKITIGCGTIFKH